MVAALALVALLSLAALAMVAALALVTPSLVTPRRLGSARPAAGASGYAVPGCAAYRAFRRCGDGDAMR
jgi:hypothetical protein